jgi:hypothetical protein
MDELKNDLTWKSLTRRTWPDFVRLFGENGGCAGCWCMFWRLPRSQFYRDAYETNKKAMQAIVTSGHVPGLIFYRNNEPAAWISVGKRADFPSLQRSRVLAPVDEQAAWAIVCYYVPRRNRGHGWLLPMTRAACEYAKAQGAWIIEAYPMVHAGKMSASNAYMGVSSVLEKTGFVEVLRRSPYHPILRKQL